MASQWSGISRVNRSGHRNHLSDLRHHVPRSGGGAPIPAIAESRGSRDLSRLPGAGANGAKRRADRDVRAIRQSVVYLHGHQRNPKRFPPGSRCRPGEWPSPDVQHRLRPVRIRNTSPVRPSRRPAGLLSGLLQRPQGTLSRPFRSLNDNDPAKSDPGGVVCMARVSARR